MLELCNTNSLFDLIELCKPEEEIPILIGYLAKKMGYKGYLTLEVGTPVYKLKNMYYVDMVSDNSISGIKDKRQIYYPNSFADDAINFVVRETKS